MNFFFLICCLLAIALFVLIPVIVFAYRKNREKHEQKLTTNMIWCITTAIAGFCWFVPYFWVTYDCTPDGWRVLKTLFFTFQGLIRVFAVDENFGDVFDTVRECGVSEAVYQLHSIIGTVLYLLAPILTFGFILSLFKNLHAYAKYYFSFSREVHIFSELNERSLALAKSIIKKAKNEKNTFSRKPLVMFADILDKNEEEHMDLMAEANECGALLFRQDITDLRLLRTKHRVSFYLISDDETEKIAHMEHIIEYYYNVANTKLFVFSDEEASKCFIDSYPYSYKENMLLEVVRVNDIRSLIYHNLDINGIRLFEKANTVKSYDDPEKEEREINAVIVGFGKYGAELAKALIWYSQVPGYRLKMTVFDENEDSEDRFRALCPEIQLNAPYTLKNDMRYEIRFENDCKVGTGKFYEKLRDIQEYETPNKIKVFSPITYVFVCLGEDNLNIETAMGIRKGLARLRCYPDVETVVYNSAIKERIGVIWDTEKSEVAEETEKGLRKKDKHKEDVRTAEAEEAKPYRDIYGIHIIGDLESFYSESTVIASDLIKAGLAVHYRYNEVTKDNREKQEKTRRTFYMDDYGFFSSVSKALHARLRGTIAKRLKENDQKMKEIFPVFAPETAKNAEEQKKREWNLFILENTVDMEKAAKLGKAMSEHGKFLTKAYQDIQKNDSSVIFPYKIDPKICALIDKEVAPFVYDGKEYRSHEVFEIVKTAADIEHIRWNAYMRAEGYSYIENFTKKYDQNMKMHGNLTPCEALNYADCIKDI